MQFDDIDYVLAGLFVLLLMGVAVAIMCSG